VFLVGYNAVILYARRASCAAKRSAATASLSAEEVLEESGHVQWFFVMTMILRPCFLHHRELLGGLAHAAWETGLELMCAAAGGGDAPGDGRRIPEGLPGAGRERPRAGLA